MTLESADDDGWAVDKRVIEVTVPVAWFTETEDKLDPDDLRSVEYDEFKYAYALTCHSAQGSQWNSVVVFDEGHAFREHRNRWRYTAVTRAISQLTVGTLNGGMMGGGFGFPAGLFRS
jgi:exodeoxyribonuclease-5